MGAAQGPRGIWCTEDVYRTAKISVTSNDVDSTVTSNDVDRVLYVMFIIVL